MKKQILLSASVVLSTMMFAQQHKPAKIPANIANRSAFKSAVKKDIPVSGTASSNTSQVIKANPKKTSSFSEAVVGTTYYDLQSNSSVADRIVVNSDNTIAATWTMDANVGTSANGYPMRGTGYAYFNGTAWSAAPTTRIETQRTGWPNVVNTPSGKEVIVAHNTVANNLQITRRNTKGTGAWSESTTAVPSPTTSGAWWPRMVSTSDTCYLIAVTQQTAATPAGSLYQGLNGAVVFSRSKDAGITWDITNVVPDGLTSTNFTGFGGDSYAIACKGTTVAVVAGSEAQDLYLSKSTDAGATWTATRIKQFPIPHWDYTTTTSDVDGDNVPDTIPTNDGTYAVVIDNAGMAHVFFGQTRVFQDAPSASGYSYFPATDGLFAWRESDGADQGGTEIAGALDLNGNGTIDLPTPANTGDFPFGTFHNSMTSFPSAAVDATNGTIYLSYSSIVEDMPSLTDPTKLVRHVYVMKSTDNGATWSDPCDIMPHDPSNAQEGVFASMAKRVDNNIHLLYQRDYAPGYGVPPTSGTNPDADNIDQPNDIVYYKLSKTDVGNCAIIDAGINEANGYVSSMSNYPNPAVNATTIDVNLKQDSKMDVVIVNNMGQTVYTTHVDGNAGSNKIDVNLSNLSAGIYFYQVRINNQTLTKKMMIQK